MNVTQNTEDDGLFTMEVQEFTAKKEGKTKTTIRMNLDAATLSLMLRVQAMKKALDCQFEKFFVDSKDRLIDGQRLRSSPLWKEFDLPKALPFIFDRRETTTFFGQVRKII